VALTYTFIFGAMFGDVGQGLCLFIGGGLLETGSPNSMGDIETNPIIRLNGLL
jgi:vacuolar-type H+-ATPase subunit I/STV1